MGEPDVAETAAEEAALPLVIGNDSERAEALVDGFGVDAFAVVGAHELVLPAAQRRQIGGRAGRPSSLRTNSVSAGPIRSWIRPRSPARRRDRSVGVSHELGDDLRQVDSGLGEVLAEVAPADAALAQLRSVDRHGTRISRTRPRLPLDNGRRTVQASPTCLEGTRSG